MKLILLILSIATVFADEDNYLKTILEQENDAFTSKFFQEVAAEESEKTEVMSAFSLLHPLAQLSLAADGETKDEILNVIGIPNDNVTRAVFPLINDKLKSVKGITFKMANKLYVAEGRKLKKSFLEVSKVAFDSEVQNVDFAKSAPAAKTINGWVEDNTNNKIKDLVSPDNFDSLTSVVLVNAIYFKGEWKEKYEPKLTRDADFHVNKEKTIKIPTMYKKDNFRYTESEDLDAKLLEIPYKGEESSLLIILPNKIDGLSELLKKLKDTSKLKKAEDDMYKPEVETFIPKFKIETKIDLKKILSKVGVKKLFSSNANLRNLIENGDLEVSSATQKAYIEINEEGAEAAAANAFIVSFASAAIPNNYVFKADHPFVFYLRIGKTTLFNGIYRA